jgi:hypothetical protein
VLETHKVLRRLRVLILGHIAKLLSSVPSQSSEQEKQKEKEREETHTQRESWIVSC